MSSRIQVILSDEELANLDSLSKSLSLNRSQTIRKLISKTKISMPVFIANKDIIGLVSELDMLLKSIIILFLMFPLQKIIHIIYHNH